MKRCPTCNRTFEEDWLAFCTQDGATLVEDSPARADEPPPTILSPPPPPPAGGWRQPSGDPGSPQFQSQPIPPPVPPSNLGGPSGGFGLGQFHPPQQMQSGWQPPPPPPYDNKPQQGLALASLILGIISIPGMFCCYFGVLTAPASIIMGIVSLVQIKNEPGKYSGKPLAIIGIVTSVLSFLFLILLFALGFASAFVQGLNR